MKIRRVIPPAAAPVSFRDFAFGVFGMGNRSARKKLEEELIEYFGTKHVFLVSSGKAALYLILVALKLLRDRRKVIIPAFTCYSVPSAVIKAGLEVVPCDIRQDTLDFDFEKLKGISDEDTLCIIPTHLFGIPSDVERVRQISRARGIFIIEDAAQALGVVSGGKKLGTLGDVSFFSLGRGKNITCGSGGVIVTNSEVLADALRAVCRGLKQEPPREHLATIISVALTNMFIRPALYWFPHGLPFLKIGESRFCKDFPIFRLSGFKARILRRWRKTLETYNRERSETGKYYIDNLDLRNSLPIYSGSIPYLRFPIYLRANQTKARSFKRCQYFGMTRLYPDSVTNIEEIRTNFRDSDCSTSETIAKTLWTLPTHSLLRDRDREDLVEIVKEMSGREPVSLQGSKMTLCDP